MGYDYERNVLGGAVGQDLIIRLDYQKLVKRLRLAWKAKEVLLSSHCYQDAGFVKMHYKFNSLDGKLEGIYFTLEGEGPFFLLGYRDLRMASKMIRSFEFNIGDIVNLNGLRLKIVANHLPNYLDYLVMLPNIWAVIFYYLIPISRWFDMIYRRLILTLVIWRLADCPPSEIPYWGHLKIFKKPEENE